MQVPGGRILRFQVGPVRAMAGCPGTHPVLGAEVGRPAGFHLAVPGFPAVLAHVVTGLPAPFGKVRPG